MLHVPRVYQHPQPPTRVPSTTSATAPGLSRKWQPPERYLGWYSGRYHGELDMAWAGLWLVCVRLAAPSRERPRSLKGAPPCLPKTPLVDPRWWSRRRVHRANPCAAQGPPTTTPTTAEPSIRAKLRNPTVPGWASARPGPAGWGGRGYCSGRRILCVLGG